MRLYKLGGVGFIASGLVFLSIGFIDLATGPPPATGVEILEWVRHRTFALSMANELLFFAAMFLVPAVIALYDSLSGIDRGKAAVPTLICQLFLAAWFVAVGSRLYSRASGAS